MRLAVVLVAALGGCARKERDRARAPRARSGDEDALSRAYCTSTRQSRDVIVYLGQKTHSSYDATHKNTLNASMESLRTNFGKIGEADVIVWHEGDLVPSDATALDGAANVRFCLLTQETGWGSPPWLPVMPESRFSAGYRYMIRFYAVTIWRTLRRLGYEWVMRFDDDSFLRSDVPYNIFHDMRKRNKLYGYRTLARECPTIFGDFVEDFVSYARAKAAGKAPGKAAGKAARGAGALEAIPRRRFAGYGAWSAAAVVSRFGRPRRGRRTRGPTGSARAGTAGASAASGSTTTGS